MCLGLPSFGFFVHERVNWNKCITCCVFCFVFCDRIVTLHHGDIYSVMDGLKNWLLLKPQQSYNRGGWGVEGRATTLGTSGHLWFVRDAWDFSSGTISHLYMTGRGRETNSKLENNIIKRRDDLTGCLKNRCVLSKDGRGYAELRNDKPTANWKKYRPTFLQTLCILFECFCLDYVEWQSFVPM